jgi:hypothetical protein
LLRISEEYEIKEELEDEFECLNLDVTMPNNVAADKPLPVLIWIYGMLMFQQERLTIIILIDDIIDRWFTGSNFLLRSIWDLWCGYDISMNWRCILLNIT